MKHLRVFDNVYEMEKVMNSKDKAAIICGGNEYVLVRIDEPPVGPSKYSWYCESLDKRLITLGPPKIGTPSLEDLNYLCSALNGLIDTSGYTQEQLEEFEADMDSRLNNLCGAVDMTDVQGGEEGDFIDQNTGLYSLPQSVCVEITAINKTYGYTEPWLSYTRNRTISVSGHSYEYMGEQDAYEGTVS